MKKFIIIIMAMVFSFIYSIPAESVNQNVLLYKIINEVELLTEKNAHQEEKLDKILNILSKELEGDQEEMSAADEGSDKLLKEIKKLLQQLIDQKDN